MNRTISTGILCTCLASAAWAQQPAATPYTAQNQGEIVRPGRHLTPQQRMTSLLMKAKKVAQPGNSPSPALASDKAKTWNLGAYQPGGSTAWMQSINDFGVAMGWGDVPVDGGSEIRMIGIPLFGLNAGQWFESGVSSYALTGEGGGISNTGLIVGNISDSNGLPEAYAWMPNQAGIRLGRYSDTGGSYDRSIALAINHSGTLIVGDSGKDLPDGTRRALPIVWRSKVVWNHGRPTQSWDLHALPTGGLELLGAVFSGVQLNYWGAWGVNDLGQIVGDGWTFDDSGNYWETAVVWTPTKGGTEWEIQRLPMAAGFDYSEALAINNLGEIVGDVWGWTGSLQGAFPVLYKPDPKNKTWSVHVLPTTSPDLTYGWSIAWGINELGDIVGYCSDENWLGKAARWNSHNPSVVTSLDFPGTSSAAYGVNNLGLAVGGYQTIVSYDKYGNPILDSGHAFAARFR